MQRPLIPFGMVDTVLKLHDAARAVCRDQFRSAAFNVAGFFGGDSLRVLVMVNRISPTQSAAGSGVRHFDKLHLGQRLENLPRFLGDSLVA